MYEFFAPWGVLVPAVSALITFFVISNLRWREEREKLDSDVSIGNGYSVGRKSTQIAA